VKALGAASLLIGGITFFGVVAFRKLTGIQSVRSVEALLCHRAYFSRSDNIFVTKDT
jgi:NAD/NADP transhydrogenase beta subunit